MYQKNIAQRINILFFISRNNNEDMEIKPNSNTIFVK